MQNAENFAGGLVNLNLCKSLNELNNIDLKFLGIYSKNTLRYFIVDIACITQDITVVPIYDTLGEESI